MAGINVNHPNPLPAWRSRSLLNLTPPLHNLPQSFVKLLPKFDPEEKTVVDDHLQRFYLALEGLRVGEYEDVVYRLFPHTLKGAAASWYCSLPTNSIPDWDTFEKVFRSKYTTQKTHASLMKGLGLLRKEKNEKVHIFTQLFSIYLKNFSETNSPSDKVLIEYYTSTLGPELAMFSQMKANYVGRDL